VKGRFIFYNNSTFDGDDPAASAEDYDAIAPAPGDLSDPHFGKQALLPGGTATFQNYTSYFLGINGVIIDIEGLGNAGALSADDFEFRVGNDDTPEDWAPAPAPQVSVDPGAGVEGSDRITLTWEDYHVFNPATGGFDVNPNGIANTWLQIVALPGENTGLPDRDVFYFGNQIAESGNSDTDAYVCMIDELGARHNKHSLVSDPATIYDEFDFDRDGKVNVTDELIARHNKASFLTAIKLIAVPEEPPLGSTGFAASALEPAEAPSAAPLALPMTHTGAAHDAVLGSTAPDGQPDAGGDPRLARLAWLLEDMSRLTQHQDGQDSADEDAADEILTKYWN
jgi:hypothetical protein